MGLTMPRVWEAHQRAKLDLLRRVSRETGTDLSPDVLTLGFARRMTGYKRLDLLFSNLDRLLATGAGPSFPDRHRRQGASARRGRQAHHPGAAPL